MKSFNTLIVFILLSLLGCGGSSMNASNPSQSGGGGGGNQSPTCEVEGTWNMDVSKQVIVNGSCPLGGSSACDPCSITALLDVVESSGSISLEPYLTGLGIGDTFEGTLDSAGQINALHPIYTGSSITADFDDSTCTIQGQLIWSPDGICQSTIDFIAEK